MMDMTHCLCEQSVLVRYRSQEATYVCKAPQIGQADLDRMLAQPSLHGYRCQQGSPSGAGCSLREHMPNNTHASTSDKVMA